MAKIEDILKLKEAGFTADDMAKLLPLVNDKPEVVEKPVVETPKVETPKVEEKKIDPIADKIDKLIERLEANALLNDTQSEDRDNKTLDDVLASIIEPKL